MRILITFFTLAYTHTYRSQFGNEYGEITGRLQQGMVDCFSSLRSARVYGHHFEIGRSSIAQIKHFLLLFGVQGILG
jgi:hypothetical protein